MKLTLLTLLTMSSSFAFAAPFELDKAHTSIDFSVTHLMVSKAKGTFREFKGAFDFDEKTGAVKDVNVEVQMDSIDTKEPKRDTHLKSPDFFDTKQFPVMTFKLDSATVKEGQPTDVKGQLTIKGTTKPVTLKLTYNGRQTDPYGTTHYGFSMTTQINRKDFGVSWSAPVAKTALDKGGLAVGDLVDISIDGEIIPKVEAKAEPKADAKAEPKAAKKTKTK